MNFEVVDVACCTNLIIANGRLSYTYVIYLDSQEQKGKEIDKEQSKTVFTWTPHIIAHHSTMHVQLRLEKYYKWRSLLAGNLCRS